MQHCFYILNSMVRNYSSCFHSKASYYRCEDRNNPKGNSIRRLSNHNFRSMYNRTSLSTSSYCTKDSNYNLNIKKVHNRKGIFCIHSFGSHRCNKNLLVHYMLKNHPQRILLHFGRHTPDNHARTRQFGYNNLPAITTGRSTIF